MEHNNIVITKSFIIKRIKKYLILIFSKSVSEMLVVKVNNKLSSRRDVERRYASLTIFLLLEVI